MQHNRIPGRASVQDLAEVYLQQLERAAGRRAADASPTGRAATVNAMADATTAFVRTQPAKSIAAHTRPQLGGAPEDSGTYAMVGGSRDIVAAPTAAATRRIELRASTSDRVVLDERALDLHRAGRVRR